MSDLKKACMSRGCFHAQKPQPRALREMFHWVGNTLCIPSICMKFEDLYTFYFFCSSGFVALAKDHRASLCNTNACLHFKKQALSLLGQPLEKFLDADATAQLCKCLAELMKTGKPFAFIAPFKSNNAESIPLHIEGFVFQKEKDPFLTACVSFRLPALPRIDRDTEKRYTQMAKSYISHIKRSRLRSKCRQRRKNHSDVPSAGKELHPKSVDNFVTLLERDRQDISNALHDQFGQLLAVLKINFQNMLNDLNSIDNAIKLQCNNICSQIDELISATRDISHYLRADHVKTLGLISSIQGLLDEIVLKTNMRCKLFAQNEINQIDGKTAIVIYRIVQESLNNILKHAKATDIWVTIKKKDTFAHLYVEDNGIGFDPLKILPKDNSAGSALGIVIMHERIKQLGGKLKIDSKPGKGTILSANIPAYFDNRKPY